jgi:hypothetical protein
MIHLSPLGRGKIKAARERARFTSPRVRGEVDLRAHSAKQVGRGGADAMQSQMGTPPHPARGKRRSPPSPRKRGEEVGATLPVVLFGRHEFGIS